MIGEGKQTQHYENLHTSKELNSWQKSSTLDERLKLSYFSPLELCPNLLNTFGTFRIDLV